jgi:hypothetical protein
MIVVRLKGVLVVERKGKVEARSRVMHRRIVSVVSSVLFALLSVMAGIMIDLEDRFTPINLGIKAAVYLDFSASELVSEAAYQEMDQLSDQLGLGLVKMAPDLSDSRSGQVFVVIGASDRFPERIRRFAGQPDSQVMDSTALAHTYSSGQYFITGDTSRLAVFKAWLEEHRVDSRWTEISLSNTLQLVVRQTDFGLSLLASTALMISLVLYWLSARARGRALRVLAGVPGWRIQIQDLSGFLVGMAAAALITGASAAGYVGLAHGWVFVPAYASVLLALFLAVILAAAAGALLLSAASWPSAAILARREPAVKILRTVSSIWQAVIFLLVLTAAAPAFQSYMEARDAAAEQAQWQTLADHVVLTFPAVMGEAGMQQIMPDVGGIVQAMEGRGAAAMSYTWDREHLSMNYYDLRPYEYFSLVNQRWLDLMLAGGPQGAGQESLAVPGLIPLPPEQVPDGVLQLLSDHMPLWTRQRLEATEGLSKITFYRYEKPGHLPLMLLSGELAFSGSAIVGVVPGLYEMFTDDFLISVASSRNLVFSGLGPTQELVEQRGLQEMIKVRYAAEEGILRAQFSAYFAQLRAGSLAALFTALVLAAGIGAFITAVLNARRDFPLRLAGRSWWEIVSRRVMRDWGAGIALALPVILFSSPDGRMVAAAAAAAALLTALLAHHTAARWAFLQASMRRF